MHTDKFLNYCTEDVVSHPYKFWGMANMKPQRAKHERKYNISNLTSVSGRKVNTPLRQY